jgi:hypothetical protein
MLIGRPVVIRSLKMEMTPEYGEPGSCLGPYTLKKRGPTFGTP